MATTVPMLRERSILAWEIESTFKTAPSASAWRSFGRVLDWADLGPVHAVFRDPVAGAGVEANVIGHEGTAYSGTIGPFQVTDPKVIGFWYGQEPNAPTSIGGGFYRHNLVPTTRGIQASFATQMLDRQGTAEASPVTDKTTFLGNVVRRMSIRGEEPGEDGGGGRLLAGLDVLAHDDDESVADKTVNLDTLVPYRYSHGKITLWGEQVFRIQSFEFTPDRANKPAYYWQDSNANKPYESPPENALYDFAVSLVADGEKFTTGGGVDKLVRQINRERLLGDGTLRFVRAASQDEFQIDLDDIALSAALKQRPASGKIVYQARGHVRASTMSYVDSNSTRFFPT